MNTPIKSALVHGTVMQTGAESVGGRREGKNARPSGTLRQRAQPENLLLSLSRSRRFVPFLNAVTLSHSCQPTLQRCQSWC